MSFIEELKRRNVFRVGIAYAVAAWLLLQLTEVLTELLQLPPEIGRTVVLVLVIGFVPAVIFAWAFELTPEGLKREKEVDRSTSITPQTGRKLDRTIIALLAVVVTWFLFDEFYLEPRQAGTEVATTAPVAGTPTENEAAPALASGPSVAVLPFVNMSADPDNEYFSDGLTETLLHMLAQLPELRVAARTSSFAFKGQNKSVAEIGSALGVAHILEGSVQKAGDRVRVTAQLVRADDGFHVWSQNYTRPLEDIFAIQDEIATDVADALGSSLLDLSTDRIEGVHTASVDAYDRYLKGLVEQAKFSYVSLPLAEGHFEAALATDPDFTEARLGLVRNNLMSFNTGLLPLDEMESRNAALLERVRVEDPDNPLARALELAMSLRPRADRDRAQLQATIDEIRGLLVQIPTETVVRRVVAGSLAGFFQDPDSAKEILQAGLLVDPLEPSLHAHLGRVQLENGELAAAEASLRRSLELEPENPNTYADLQVLEKERNNLATALDWARRAIEVDPQDHELAAQLARDLYLLRLPEEADRWLARAKALAPESGLTRSVEMEGALARGQDDTALNLAYGMVADGIEERHGSFGNALSAYMDLMAEAGRGREAFDALVDLRPEVANPGVLARDFAGIFMQWSSMGLRRTFAPEEESRAAWETFTAQLDAMGFPWREPDGFNGTWDLVLRGETEAAVEQYLAGPLQEPLATNLRIVHQPLAPVMRDVYDDPRVMARLAELEDEFEAMRDDVQAMLLNPEWSE